MGLRCHARDAECLMRAECSLIAQTNSLLHSKKNPSLDAPGIDAACYVSSQDCRRVARQFRARWLADSRPLCPRQLRCWGEPPLAQRTETQRGTTNGWLANVLFRDRRMNGDPNTLYILDGVHSEIHGLFAEITPA